MIRHLIKLVWSRKRANALLVLEIFVSFLVLFAVTCVGLIFSHRVSQPLGFSYDSVYTASIDSRRFDEVLTEGDERQRIRRVVDELRRLPATHAVGVMSYGPFDLAYSSTDFEYNGLSVDAGYTGATDGIADALGIEVVQGRWFEEADDAFDWIPVVINRRMVDALFPDRDPLGQIIKEEPQLRVVGVIDDFRKNGTLSSLTAYVIRRESLAVEDDGGAPRRIMIRVGPEAGAGFEELALDVMRRVEPGWSFQIEPTDSIRRRNFKLAVAPIVIGTLVAASLMVMVFLGMVGVFWQAVTQRVGEIGLRRALGADRPAVYRQMLLEIVLVAVTGAFLATILILQLPILGLLGSVAWSTIISALFLSLLIMCSLAIASGLYPSWLASKIQPAQALHDE
ncbi:MAG: FtsX-like permease family protein [bacterium]|nr:FtsX-like permease family protein [bacterium]